MDKKPPKTKKEKIPEKDNDVSNSSSVSVSGPTIPQRPYKLGINILNEKHIFFVSITCFYFTAHQILSLTGINLQTKSIIVSLK